MTSVSAKELYAMRLSIELLREERAKVPKARLASFDIRFEQELIRLRRAEWRESQR